MGDFFGNLCSNLPASTRHPHICQLTGWGKGVPAVILGAGPSLDEALPLLRGDCGVFILSSAAALLPAIAAGVVPHAVVTCDPSPVVESHFPPRPGALPPVVYEVAGWSGVPSGSVWPDAPRICCSIEDSEFSPLVRCFQRPGVLGWGTVVSVALGVAHVLGFNPILFAGVDLAGSPDGWSHSAGSPFRAPIPLDGDGILIEKDMGGSGVPTTPAFRAFRKFLTAQARDEFEIFGTHHINASGGVWSGVRRAPLPLALAAYRAGGIRPLPSPPSDWTPQQRLLAVRQLLQLAHDLERHPDTNKLPVGEGIRLDISPAEVVARLRRVADGML